LLEQAREDLIVSFSTTYYGIQVDAGNVVSVTNSDYGWSSKLFRVMKVNEASLPDGSLGARLELSEYNAQVYDNQDITQFTPVPNSGLASPTYFSALATPTVTGYPSASVPNFSVQVFIPVTGRVTFANLFYTTSATPTAADWLLLGAASTSNSQPVTNNSYYTFQNQILAAGTYYFAYLVGNDTSQSILSSSSTAFVWSPVASVGPTGPTGNTGPTGTLGPTGNTGNSSRICYSKTTLSSLSPTPTTITTSGINSYPPNDSWGTGTVWGATAPAITAGESVYQSDGVYSPVTGNTVWNVPYLSTLKVGALSAITTNTGTLTVDTTGYLRGGQTAYNTGTGFFLGYSGATYKFSIGSSTVNMLWDGSSFTINGGSINGGTINIGTGGSPSGSSFEINSAGVVYVDNIFGGIGVFGNSRYPALNSIYSATYQNHEAIYGIVANSNANSSAHGVRGANAYNGTSGLVGVANGYDFYADGSGTNYGPFTGNHDILLPIDQTLTEGTLLVDVTCIAKNGWSNAIFQVAPSTQANQAGARGVFVGELRPLSSVQPPVFIDHWTTVDGQQIPVMTAQYEAIKNDYWFGSMNALGEGQIQVCGENGDIAVDTLIVASSTTGVGMAQTDDIVRGYTVAKARQAITFSGPTDVQIVACIYISG
jgi:hypothetical protein